MAMRFWTPSPIWTGRHCYVVGGGPSLRGFDWERLRGQAVIGCNVCCYQDPAIIPWTIFGDSSFVDAHKDALEKYVAAGGKVVTNSSRYRQREPVPEWLKIMPKQNVGMSKEKLGWNGNTGASAINLALLLGAQTVYLLGYDMQVQDGKANYHTAYVHGANPKAYPRFLRRMKHVVNDLHRLWPGHDVINLEDGTSAMPHFPKASLREHFAAVATGA